MAAWAKTIVAASAVLILAPLTTVPAPAVAAPSARAEPELVGLWDTGFQAQMTRADCGRWTLDAQGFCTADDVRNGLELGMKFQSSGDLVITGIRIYRVDPGAVTGTLWDADGTRLATGDFAPTATTGWQDLIFSTPVAISSDRTYIASYYSPATKYAFRYGLFADEVARGPITALRSVDGDPNGVHCYDVHRCRYPTIGFRDSGYWVTPLWQNPVDEPLPPPAVPAPPADREPPKVRTTLPSVSATQVGRGRKVAATFSEHVRAALLTKANVRLLRKGQRKQVAARLRYDEGRGRLTIVPRSRLRPRSTYRVVITTRVVDVAGNRLDQDPRRAGAQQATWRFRTR